MAGESLGWGEDPSTPLRAGSRTTVRRVRDARELERGVRHTGLIVRQVGLIIGELDRDHGLGVRDQKRKDLRRRWRGCLGGGGLDTRRQCSVLSGQKSGRPSNWLRTLPGTERHNRPFGALSERFGPLVPANSSVLLDDRRFLRYVMCVM